MKRIIEYIRGKLLNNPEKRETIDIYNLSITSANDNITKKDLNLISFFLKFTPSENKLFSVIKKWNDDTFVNISCESNNQNWISCTQKMLTVDEILKGTPEDYLEDFFWLIEVEKIYDIENIMNHVIDFINSNKKEYQSICSKKSRIYFSRYSDVNSYTVVWGQENYLNCIVSDVG